MLFPFKDGFCAVFQTINKMGAQLPECNEGAQLLHFLFRRTGFAGSRSGGNLASLQIFWP